MSDVHRLQAVATFLHGSLHQQGADGSVGSADDGGHIWMSYHTPEGQIHQLHLMAVLADGAPRLAARHFVADTSSGIAQQIAAWLREHARG